MIAVSSRAVARLIATATSSKEMADARLLLCFEYENSALNGTHRKGLLWYDSGLNAIQWQCGSTITPFHGRFFQDADGIEVAFNARTTDTYRPELKATKVVRSGVDGVFYGWDYQARFITLRYLSKWHEVGNSWSLYGTWSTDFEAWVIHDPDEEQEQ